MSNIEAPAVARRGLEQYMNHERGVKHFPAADSEDSSPGRQAATAASESPELLLDTIDLVMEPFDALEDQEQHLARRGVVVGGRLRNILQRGILGGILCSRCRLISESELHARSLAMT
jgi:hypothetical protein